MVKKNDGGYGKEFEQYTVTIQSLRNSLNDENLPEYVTTAHKIDPFFRVKMQGTIQKYIDSQYPLHEFTRGYSSRDIADIYESIRKWIKGITVYREEAEKAS